jgi:hypothetical protein
MRYDDILDKHVNEPHDLSDQFDISTAVTVNQLPLMIAQMAIDCGLSPMELVTFMRGDGHV